MKKKIIGILVCTLLIAATVLPVAGTINNVNVIEDQNSDEYEEPQYDTTSRVNDEWPMYLYDPENTGYSTASIAPQTNTVKWTYTTGEEVTSSPAVVNGKVYIGSFDENFYCLDAETGLKLWNYPVPGFSGCGPAVYDGKVYVGSDYDYFYCFDADTGSLIWTFFKDYGPSSGSSPAVVDGKVYFAHARGGGQDAALYCLDADTGSEYWKYPMGYFEVSSPAVYNGKIYIGSEDCNLYCIDADTGDLIWSYTTGMKVFSSPAVADSKVYLGSTDRKLYCFDADTGNILWVFDTGSSYVWSSPAVAYDNVYITSHKNKKVHCLNADTGDFIWDYTTGGEIYVASPVVADEKLYVNVWETGKLLCLDALTGEFIWTYQIDPATPAWLFGSPAIAYGKLYVGGGLSRKVYCFEDPSRPPTDPTINGPGGGKPGEEYDFTFVTTDPEGDDVYYYIDWGDDTNTGWIGSYPSGEEITVSHAWTEAGTYVIQARAKDTYGIKGHWSELNIVISTPPNTPIIDGLLEGDVGVPYTYMFVSTDPDDDDITSYTIDWGDDNIDVVEGPFESGEEVSEPHTWDETGTYTIKAKAKDINSAESDWGELVVTMPRNKAINTPFQNFIQNYPNLFPILRLLIQRLGLQ